MLREERRGSYLMLGLVYLHNCEQLIVVEGVDLILDG